MSEKLAETIKWLRSQAAEFTAAADALERAARGRLTSDVLEARTRECLTKEILGHLERKQREGKAVRAGDIADALMISKHTVEEIIGEHSSAYQVGEKGWIKANGQFSPVTSQALP